MRRSIAAVLLGLSALLLVPGTALAQGEDAVPLRAGALRVIFAPDWSRFNRRFGKDTPGFADGALEPLGVDFGADTFGVAALPFLAPIQTRVRDLTGLGGFVMNLGRTSLALNASVRVMPVGIELGLSRRLSVSVTVPLVRSRMEAFFALDTAAARRGNVGWNPAFLTPGALDGFRAQVEAALERLRTLVVSGPASLRGQAQSTLDAVRPLLCGLYSLAGGSAGDAASPCFLATPTASSPFLPLTGSAAGDSLAVRLARARGDYELLRQQYAALGFLMPALDAAYTLPAAPLDSLGFRRLFSDPVGPLAGDSLTTVVRTRLGDIELGAALQVAASPRYRGQLALVVRLPTGTVDFADNFIDVGTGDHQLDLEVGTRNDFVLGSRFWLHAGARAGIQFADDLTRRVAPVNLPLAPPRSRAVVRRDLGDYVAVDVVPNWQLDDAFSLAVGYHYYRQGATRVSYVDATDEARTGLPASVLAEETAVSRTRIGAGVTFSTLGRYAAGRASLPYTVTASYQNTFQGKGGAVPQASIFRLAIRGHISVW